MKVVISITLLLLGIVQFSCGQTSGSSILVNAATNALEPPANTYAVMGATPQQEVLVRTQIQVMQPSILPLRVIFVPHWKYEDAARIFSCTCPPAILAPYSLTCRVEPCSSTKTTRAIVV